MKLAIEIVGRPGRWIFEAAFACIILMALFSAAGVVLLIACTFTSVDPQPVIKHLPTAGWFVGLGLSLFRLGPCLRKPIAKPYIDEELDSTSSETSFSYSPGLAASLPLATRASHAAKSGGIGFLLGTIAAIAISVYLCIVATAVISCPLAPRAWTDGLVTRSVDTAINNDSVSINLWHPVFGTIVGVCLVTGITLGTVAGITFGAFAVDSEPANSEESLG